MSDFYGLPTDVLENNFLRLEYLPSGGPRVVRFSLPGGSNLLAELPDLTVKTLPDLINLDVIWMLHCFQGMPAVSWLTTTFLLVPFAKALG